MAVSLVKSDYRIVCGYERKMPEYQRAALQASISQAIGYVWGWQDAGGRRSRSNDNDPWDFGYAFGVAKAEYLSGARGSLPAIARAFTNWLDGKRLGAF